MSRLFNKQEKTTGTSLNRCFSACWVFTAAALLAAMSTGCELRQGMYNESRYKPLEKTDFFANGSTARMLIPQAVARGSLREDPHLYEGKVGDAFAESFPFEITREDLARGQERFNIYCAVCHDQTGSGDGIVVQRGFRKPSSYHIDRLRDMPVGYFYDVISRGFGVMPSYAYQIKVEDRWRVVAYIKALQLSQNATLSDVPEEMKSKILTETK